MPGTSPGLASQASREGRPGFFHAGSHVRSPFLTPGNRSSSFPEPRGFRHGTVHDSTHHVRSPVAGHQQMPSSARRDSLPQPSRGSGLRQAPGLTTTSPGNSGTPPLAHKVPALQTQGPERGTPRSRGGRFAFSVPPFPSLSSTTARPGATVQPSHLTDDKLRPRGRKGLLRCLPTWPAQRYGSLGPDSGLGLDSQQLLVGEKGRV